MAVPSQYSHLHLPVKYFLSSYRALSDARTGIEQLRDRLTLDNIRISDWRVLWIGTCTTLRTSIDLFKVDKKSCLDKRIRDEIGAEWKSINSHRDEHSIFWNFLKKERDQIVHEYAWTAYEVWMDEDNKPLPNSPSLLSFRSPNERCVISMKHGPFKDRDSLELLNESAEWVENRILNAILRAGYFPDELRNIVTFLPLRPIIDIASPTLLGPRN